MKKIAILLTGLFVLLSACKTGKTDEENMEKLLESQEKMQSEQQERLGQLQDIQDSLMKERRSLVEQRNSKDQEIRNMEADQQVLAEKLKEEQTAAVQSEKEALEKRITAYQDSITLLKSDLSQLNAELDSIEQNMSLYAIQETRTEKSLESGIAEIDQRMRIRENRQEQELKRMNLLERRIAVVDEKIEALEMEQDLYTDERDELRRSNATEEALMPFQEKIAELSQLIQEENDNKRSLEADLTKASVFVAETDSILNNLNMQIQQEYDKKEIIESFIISEKERLQKELVQLKDERGNLLAEQTRVSNNISQIEQEMVQLDQDVKLIQNKELSEILEKQAELERSEAKLAEEEINLLELDSWNKIIHQLAEASSDSTSDELLSVMTLGQELDSLSELIQAEKLEVTKTRKELAEKRAESASKRAQIGKTAGAAVVALVIAGVLLLSLFYFLGRRSRKS